MSRNAYYPVFVDLEGRRCLIIGGGLVAERKVTTLLKYGAAITVVSPTLTRRLSRYVRQRKIWHVARPFRANDLHGAWLVYAATDDQRINELVSRAASRRRVFANIVDEPRLCSFIAPAQVKQGDLVIAISTGGGSPALAKRIRQELQHLLGPHYGRMLRLLEQLRPQVQRRLKTPTNRKRFFEQLLNGSVFRFVQQGRFQQARRSAMSLLVRAAKAGPRRTDGQTDRRT